MPRTPLLVNLQYIFNIFNATWACGTAALEQICCAGFRQQSSGGGDLGVGGDTTVGSRDTLWQYGNVAIWQNCRMAIWQCGMDVYLVKNDRRNSRDTLRQKETKTDRQTDYHLSELKNDQ